MCVIDHTSKTSWKCSEYFPGQYGCPMCGPVPLSERELCAGYARICVRLTDADLTKVSHFMQTWGIGDRHFHVCPICYDILTGKPSWQTRMRIDLE